MSSPEEYRSAYLEGIGRAVDAPADADNDFLLPPHRLRGPDGAVMPLKTARRAELLEVLRRQVPDAVESMDVEAFDAWLHETRMQAGRVERLEQMLEEAARERAVAAEQATHLQAILASPSFRVGRVVIAPLRALRLAVPVAKRFVRNPRSLPRQLRRARQLWREGGLSALRRKVASRARMDSAYQLWLQDHGELRSSDRQTFRERLAHLRSRPLISILMPVYNTDPQLLRESVDSVRRQLYDNWELCIADDASTRKETVAALTAIAEEADQRIRIVRREENGHIARASNTALETARGDWIGLLDHDDLLAEDALVQVVEEINRSPDAGLIYSDEDKISELGERYDPYFKPDWNPDLLRSQNYLNHFSVYRADVVREAGGFRTGFEGSQDYDLALRVVERLSPQQIRHIPRILYHWRAVPESTASIGTAKPYTVQAAERALREHLDRAGMRDAVPMEAPQCPGMWRIRYPLPDPPPRVSIIIPTRNGLSLLLTGVESILRRTDYPDLEVIIVDNGSDDPATLGYLETLEAQGRARIIRDDAPFNFSALNNRAVREASGSVVALVNNDIEVIHGDWLREMVSHAVRPGVGVVGARLWYPDDTLQHGGCVLGIGGVAGHVFLGLPRSDSRYFGRSSLLQNYSAVTAACMVLRRSVFDEVGGLDEQNLAVAFNDIDFCIRVREAGYWNVWTPYAELYHHESASRGSDLHGEKRERFMREVRYMQRRWGDVLRTDPAYNPNLSLETNGFDLAERPRLPVEGVR